MTSRCRCLRYCRRRRCRRRHHITLHQNQTKNRSKCEERKRKKNDEKSSERIVRVHVYDLYTSVARIVYASRRRRRGRCLPICAVSFIAIAASRRILSYVCVYLDCECREAHRPLCRRRRRRLRRYVFVCCECVKREKRDHKIAYSECDGQCDRDDAHNVNM